MGTRRKASASPKVNCLPRTLKFNSTDFFSNPQNPPRVLPVHDVIHMPRSHFLSGVSIVTSLNDTSVPHAREHLRSCLPLTNSCAKRKALSLTKPKGKIYRTKSLGHYITIYQPFISQLVDSSLVKFGLFQTQVFHKRFHLILRKKTTFCHLKHFVENEKKDGNHFMQGLMNIVNEVEHPDLNLIIFFLHNSCWMCPCVIMEKHDAFPIDERVAFS